MAQITNHQNNASLCCVSWQALSLCQHGRNKEADSILWRLGCSHRLAPAVFQHNPVLKHKSAPKADLTHRHASAPKHDSVLELESALKHDSAIKHSLVLVHDSESGGKAADSNLSHASMPSITQDAVCGEPL